MIRNHECGQKDTKEPSRRCKPMCSANRHPIVLACAVMLFGGLPSAGQTHEVPMSHKQNAQSQEQATRTAIDGFNEAFNRHDADALAEHLTDDTIFEDTSP